MLCNLESRLINVINIIAPNNLQNIFDLLLGKENNVVMKHDEILHKLFLPINVWDSYCHVNLKTEKKKSTTQGLITKNMFESLMENKPTSPNGTSLGSNSIIIGEISLPSFLKSLTEVMIKDSGDAKKVDRKLYFDINEINEMMGDKEFMILKNTNSTTILEEISGLVLYFKINGRTLVVQGIMKEDKYDIL